MSAWRCAEGKGSEDRGFAASLGRLLLKERKRQALVSQPSSPEAGGAPESVQERSHAEKPCPKSHKTQRMMSREELDGAVTMETVIY